MCEILFENFFRFSIKADFFHPPSLRICADVARRPQWGPHSGASWPCRASRDRCDARTPPRTPCPPEKKFEQISDFRTPWRGLTGPTMSDTWDTDVPEAAPKYNTLAPVLKKNFMRKFRGKN